jgi:arylsulfatase A-like enzyme
MKNLVQTHGCASPLAKTHGCASPQIVKTHGCTSQLHGCTSQLHGCTSPQHIRASLLPAIAGLTALLWANNLDAQQKNVLFIAVDDLRPELGCFGHPVVKSPNIDNLAASGAAFSRAYCNIAVCGASRASIMSGVRPGPQRFVGADCYLDQHLPGAVSMPMHFRNNGYHTVSLGKIFHHQNDSKGSWEINWRPETIHKGSGRDYMLPENLALDRMEGKRGMPWEKADVPDEAYKDGKTALKAIEEMEKAQSRASHSSWPSDS